MYRLDIRVRLDRTLVQGDDLDQFQMLLHKHAPFWSRDLCVWFDRPRTPIDVTVPGELARTLRVATIASSERHAKFWEARNVPPHVWSERRMGSEELRGTDVSLIVITDLDDLVLRQSGDDWHWGNSITIQICRKHVEGLTAGRWAHEMFLDICSTLAPVHAFASMSAEYDLKNMSCAGGGVQAMGTDCSKALLGLYWLNYLGHPYCELIGHDRLMTAPAPEVRTIRDGVMIGLSDDPGGWRTLEYQRCERAVLRHLGTQYFFDRTHPHRQTVAPAFDFTAANAHAAKMDQILAYLCAASAQPKHIRRRQNVRGNEHPVSRPAWREPGQPET